MRYIKEKWRRWYIMKLIEMKNHFYAKGFKPLRILDAVLLAVVDLYSIHVVNDKKESK